MIPRYSRPEMVAIWEPATKFRIWYEIEAHACDAQARLGVIPQASADAVWKARDVEFDVARIDEIEAVTKHDVIAFLTHLSEHIGSTEARFVHQGMTSSDVLDTTFNVQLVRAADILLAGLDRVLAALKARAFEHKDTVRIGRSHGIHAEPTTMGLTFARFYAEMDRNRTRLENARLEISTGAISGAVGTFANIDPAVEEHVCAKLGLRPEPISTQVIPRDRHAMFFATLGVIASSIENIAIEIRHMQRTEVLEAEEFFSAGQKGSSAMPHKRNPVLSGKPDRAGAPRAHVRGAGAGKRGAVARTRHLAFLGRTRDRPRHHDHARLRAAPPCGRHRKAGDLPRQHAGQHEQVPRPRDVAARSARAHAGGRQPRGQLPPGAAQRHEGLGEGRRFRDRTARRSGGDGGADARSRSRKSSTSAITPSMSTRSLPAFSASPDPQARILPDISARPGLAGTSRAFSRFREIQLFSNLSDFVLASSFNQRR